MRAKVSLRKLQAGDVVMTHADISRIKKVANYKPSFSITDGIKNFIILNKIYFEYIIICNKCELMCTYI